MHREGLDLVLFMHGCKCSWACHGMCTVHVHVINIVYGACRVLFMCTSLVLFMAMPCGHCST